MNNTGVGACSAKDAASCYYDNAPQAQPPLPTQGQNESFHESMQKYTDSYFWRKLATDVEQTTPNGLRNLKMPLARVKRMIKSDDEVKKMVERC